MFISVLQRSSMGKSARVLSQEVSSVDLGEPFKAPNEFPSPADQRLTFMNPCVILLALGFRGLGRQVTPTLLNWCMKSNPLQLSTPFHKQALESLGHRGEWHPGTAIEVFTVSAAWSGFSGPTAQPGTCSKQTSELLGDSYLGGALLVNSQVSCADHLRGTGVGHKWADQMYHFK